jgi:hypothetical protein
MRRASHNLKDLLNELLLLNNVKVASLEWVPFGLNQFLKLNERLGVLDRCQGGMFDSKVDRDSNSSQLHILPCATKVSILDFDYSKYANLEAHYYSDNEDNSINHIESFGIHMRATGEIFCGSTINSIMHQRTNNMSLDLISRVMVDLQSDATRYIFAPQNLFLLLPTSLYHIVTKEKQTL